MTTTELRKKFNSQFGIGVDWPKTYEVDAETYGNVCQSIFNNLREKYEYNVIEISLGEHGGIMFKNVELIIKEV